VGKQRVGGGRKSPEKERRRISSKNGTALVLWEGKKEANKKSCCEPTIASWAGWS